MKRLLSALCILAAAAMFGAGTVRADDPPAETIPGKLLIVKGGKLAKFIAKPVSPLVFDLPDTPANDPTLEGASLRIAPVAPLAIEDLATTLPAGGWKGLGNPAGSKGFKYKGAGSATDPCKVVLVKPKIIKGVCKGPGVDLAQPIPGEVTVLLTVGTGTKTYCTAFGGTESKNDATMLKRKDATPAACSCGTSIPGSFTFRNTPPSASDCGDITTAAGVTSNLVCNGLYIGSGGGSLSLPETVPDSNKALVMDVACCMGDALLLKATTSAGTGDIETCTSVGCKFGAPLPLPNPMSPATSTCVFNTYAQDVVGEATCSDGNVRLDMPLISRTFLGQDILPRRCSGGTNAGMWCSPLGVAPQCTGGGTCVADSDLQPCPICNTTTGKCNGGFNGMEDGNQAACTPDGGQNIALPQFPTSHSCTISTLGLVGDLPVPFLLSTGTQSKTAGANNGMTQTRIFCGHCRDQDGTGTFGMCNGGTNPNGQCDEQSDCTGGGVCEAKPCESDTECAGDPASRESCEQRSDGAFGPNGSGNMTITEIGTPAGDISDFAGHTGTMISVFCIPPAFNPVIDTAADIPGPGAVSLPGVFDVNSPSGAFVDGSNLF